MENTRVPKKQSKKTLDDQIKPLNCKKRIYFNSILLDLRETTQILESVSTKVT